MNQIAATDFIAKTFNSKFDDQQFEQFVANLLNKVDRSKVFRHRSGNYIPQKFRGHISTYRRPFVYYDPNGDRLDVLIVKLHKESNLERARTMQRNFAADYLKKNSDETIEAALIAFYHEDVDDWRFSLVKLEYAFGDEGFEERLTPARRYSFLVGPTEPTHTAEEQLRPFLINDAENPTIEELTAAFQIETVSKKFFTEYKGLFLELVEGVETVIKDDKTLAADFERANIYVPNFSKKLLGQIVFLYFVQKKGWMGVDAGRKWGSGPKDFLRRLFEKENGVAYDNFFNDVLEPLFYDALAVRRADDLFPIAGGFECKIPFLNGGLFEPMGGYDWAHTKLLLPNSLFSNRQNAEDDEGTGILDVFDRYNFTVWEEEPLEKEVAVDPEMLGKVFENLLEVQDRKSKGAFYTPREIVHYMCQESLINYLDTAVGGGEKETVSREEIGVLVRQGALALQHDAAKEAGLKKDAYILPANVRGHAAALDMALANIKVCDPAIGSGAFPVGMLHEIVQARMALDTQLKNTPTPYQLKRHAIQESIYGVDIDDGAVEIAKLRLWLSLVVDEESYDNIQPLPNLDYKIVRGNSLLGVEKNLFNLPLFTKLDELKRGFFDETHRQEKIKLKAQIDLLIEQLTDGNHTFDFEVYFHEVFAEQGGFDVVIGNPPWMSLKGKQKQIANADRLLKVLSRQFKVNTYMPNLYEFFLQQGLNVSRENGILCYIVPDRFGFNSSSTFLRKMFIEQTEILEIVYKWNFPQIITDTMTFITKKRRVQDYIISIRNDTLGSYLQFSKKEILDDHELQFRTFESEKHKRLVYKIKANATKLEDLASSTSGFGGKSKLITKERINEEQIQVYKGASIRKYKIVKPLYFEFKDSNITGRTRDERKLGVKIKILLRKTGTPIIATYDASGTYPEQSLYFIYNLNSSLHYFYVLALLNSKLINWFYINYLVTNLDSTPQLKNKDLDMFPIKMVATELQQPFINLVTHILNTKSALTTSDTVDLEAEIDQLVHKLYDLSDEEIAIIEGGNK